MIKVKFVKGGKDWELDAQDGQTIRELAQENDVDLECACEGSLACSTCHVVVRDEGFFKKCCEITPISDEEEDMLDLAQGLTKKSRLGCQVVLTPDLDGAIFDIPAENRNTPPETIKSDKSDSDNKN
jgi:2Fe-2S ferredoxin